MNLLLIIYLLFNFILTISFITLLLFYSFIYLFIVLFVPSYFFTLK
jgi:hypothetical protein